MAVGLSAGTDALRSLIYRSFAAAFEYPDCDALAAIRDGAVAEALRDAGPDDDALQVEFTRLFEAGEAGPCCPLHGGHYGGGGMQTLEELVRFYNFFGLSLSEERREQPDHLTTELEFLHFLSFQEAQAAGDEDGLKGLQRAQRDFLARHPASWVSLLRRALAAEKPLRFFAELARLLERFLEAELRRVTELAGEAPRQDPAPANWSVGLGV